MNDNKIIVIDSIMGSGKTTWCIDELINKRLDQSILYIAPYLNECNRIINAAENRQMVQPKNFGDGKLENIIELLDLQSDIASTHELFRRFDERCMDLLDEYTLILDETLTAVEPYQFSHTDDYEYLTQKGDIVTDENGIITWTGSDELDTRFDDVRILAKNQCLFKIDKKFFVWSFPNEIFRRFKKVYIMTYLFEGSIMKYYLDLFGFKYTKASIAKIDDDYTLVDYQNPDKTEYQNRIKVYRGKLNTNFSKKSNVLSATWCKSPKSKDDRKQLQKNLQNFTRNICKAKSDDTMWTTYKDNRKHLTGKGYGSAFIPCNCRSTNDYDNATCLAYCVNWYENPEIIKFFEQRGIKVNQDMIALSNILQWIWRSNIRVPDSKKIINIYIPSRRMRELFLSWLHSDAPEQSEIA